ncbi:MAG TPA: hypothetical protein VEX88_02840 [Glaciibacter sp.]|nr:hypothetical protein [Glaciibacter sp.]
MARKVSVIVLTAGIALCLTACMTNTPAYSELSRDKVEEDALPIGIGLFDPRTDSNLLGETSRLVGTSNGIDYFLVLNEQPITERDNRPGPPNIFPDSRGRIGVCIVMFAKANGGEWVIGCGDGSASEMAMGGTWARYLPPGHDDDEDPALPDGWVQLSDNLIASR